MTAPDTTGRRPRMAELRRLEAAATPGPWQWLDSGGDPGGFDELQDGHGEQIATGFRDDINLDGPPPGHMTDGRLCAAMRNALPDLLAVAEQARLVSQWHDSIGSGPIEELNAELGALRAALAGLDR